MKKYLPLTFVVAMLSLVAIGCSGGSSDTTVPTKTPPKLKSDAHAKGTPSAPGGQSPTKAL